MHDVCGYSAVRKRPAAYLGQRTHLTSARRQ